MEPRKGIFGLPLYEWAICVVIAAIVIGVAAERIDHLLEFSEKTAVETTVMNIRSGLRLEKARRIAAGVSMRDLVRRNPLDFLAPQPSGLGGEKVTNLLETANSFDWYYESKQSVLVYRPSRQRHLKLEGADADKLLSWQIRARSADGSDADLVVVVPYQWF